MPQRRQNWVSRVLQYSVQSVKIQRTIIFMKNICESFLSVKKIINNIYYSLIISAVLSCKNRFVTAPHSFQDLTINWNLAFNNLSHLIITMWKLNFITILFLFQQFSAWPILNLTTSNLFKVEIKHHFFIFLQIILSSPFSHLLCFDCIRIN